MTVTIYDVAREAGVSMATVSRVVNGNPNVKQTTRQKVIDTINRLGYRPNAVARGLASKKTTTVGAIIPDISSMFFADLARGIEDIAGMYHYNVILANSDRNQTKELQLIDTMLEKQVDGILFMGGYLSEEHIKQLSSTSVPIVLASTYDETNVLPSVNIDNKTAAYEATQFLIERGHEKIAFVHGHDDSLISQFKYQGYLAALEDYRLRALDEYIIKVDYSYKSGIVAAKELLALKNRPTAVFSASDEMALGVIHGIQDLGYNVPNDIEVFGFNNTSLAVMVRPTLSTIVQPMYDIGAVSMRLLTKLMSKEKVNETKVILPHRIIERDSTK